MKRIMAYIMFLMMVMATMSTNVNATENWLWPLGSAYGYNNITSSYGYRTYNNRNHNGVDIGAPAGTKIYASRGGIISESNENKSAGNYVVVDHGDGYTTKYMHMSKRAVKKGEKVSRGTVIGYVGNTGDSQGNHLHFEMKYSGSYVNTNPADYPIKGSVVNGVKGKIKYSFDMGIKESEAGKAETVGISNPNQVVKNGSRGAGVVELQQSLNKIMNAGLDVDGKCGPKTVTAIKEFQKKYGLEVDGAAGPKTNAKINELLKHNHTYKNHYEEAHPHKRYKLCECGDKVYVEGSKMDSNCEICYPPHQHSFKTGYEKVHPHKVYRVCSCGTVEYTGEFRKVEGCEECHEHNFAFETEKKHPHKEYRICNDCGYEEYTGEFTVVETCKLCYPEEKEKRTLKLQIGIPQMYIDGVRTEIDPGRGTVPIMKNNRTLLPVRAVVETFDAYVIWDENEEKITVIRDDITIQLWIDSTIAYVNDEEYELDVVPVVINSRTFMPLRFIAENLGLTVGWNEANQTVTVEGTIQKR